VAGVGIVIDAENAVACTSFQLDHIRTENEDKQDGTSIEHHPLYMDNYYGAPLVDEFLFPN
jgi:hypothetical protein